MKKIIFVLILLFVSISVYADMDMDGYDWMTWDNDSRITYVMGFMSAMQTMGEMMVDAGGDPVFVDSVVFIPYSVGNLVNAIESFYQLNREYRSFTIRSVIFVLSGLDYWNEE